MTDSNLSALVDKQWLSPTYVQSFESLSGAQAFTLFSKSDKWDNELYEYLVSPHYDLSFAWGWLPFSFCFFLFFADGTGSSF